MGNIDSSPFGILADDNSEEAAEVRERELPGLQTAVEFIPGMSEVVHAADGDLQGAGIAAAGDLLLFGVPGVGKLLSARAAKMFTKAPRAEIIAKEGGGVTEGAAKVGRGAVEEETTAMSRNVSKGGGGVTEGAAKVGRGAVEDEATAMSRKGVALRQGGADAVVVDSKGVVRVAKGVGKAAYDAAAIAVPAVAWSKNDCPDGHVHKGAEAFGEGLLAGLGLSGIKCETPVLPDEPISENGPLERKHPEPHDELQPVVQPHDELQPVVHRREVTYEYPIVPAAALLALAAVVSARA